MPKNRPTVHQSKFGGAIEYRASHDHPFPLLLPGVQRLPVQRLGPVPSVFGPLFSACQLRY